MKFYYIAIDKVLLLTLEEDSDGRAVEICKLPPNATFISMENIGDCLHFIYSIPDEETE